MQILILGLNFYPELTGIGKYTGEMAACLTRRGHHVRVITAPPYYPYWQVQKPYLPWVYKRESWQGMQVYRCPLWVPKRVSGFNRIVHLASFALSSLPVMLMQAFWKPDIVLCVAPTLFSAPSALLAACLSGAKAWIHIQDFELDAAFSLQMLPGRGLFYPLAEACEKFLLTRFRRVSTISENMVKRCLAKGVQPDRIFLLPNWVDTKTIRPMASGNPLRAELGLSDGTVVILYHGNMGHKQGLELVVEAAKRLVDKSQVVFVFCGDGGSRSEIEQLARGLSNVRFLKIQPEERLNALVNLADIHVLPQLSGAADLVMPSKLTGMLASGRAIVACAEPGTQIWQVLKDIGRVVPPEDAQQLADAILELAYNPAKRVRLGSSARAFAEEYLDRDKILNRLGESLDHFG